MKFNKTFYHYQKDILWVFEKELDSGDNKIHIVAPPGSGKTIVWIEMLRQLFLKKNWVGLILVPNTLLQEQWKDKIHEFFIEEHEKTDDLVSTSLDEMKRINILTYQSISQQDNTQEEAQILSHKVVSYFTKLQTKWVSAIVLDEAHHLTAWWSLALYKLYIFLSLPSSDERLKINTSGFVDTPLSSLSHQIAPHIVGLTATPPFKDTDYFTLDKHYINLLGEVDYYIPTPAIIKSWKLAPYNDLVQFVELPSNHKDLLEQKHSELHMLINKYNSEISDFFTKYLWEYDKNINEDRYIHWVLNFCNKYLTVTSSSFQIENFTRLVFKDITYSLSIWLRSNKNKSYHNNAFEQFKKVLYEIWYVWKKSKFVKYFSYIDKLAIYNPEKIHAIQNIIDTEESLLWKNLRLVIITDFLDDVDWLLDCTFILKNLSWYSHLNPTLVSGKWIWNSSWEILGTDILSVTKQFNRWEIHILIGTRWMLWEWWDSPKVNTLIDVTWISSFMWTNQVRWRAIRQDKENQKKVSNIYDIVTISKNAIVSKDMNRLRKKHNQVYWVDDSGLVIKWINHIYQNLEQSYHEHERINSLMLQRAAKRAYFHTLWNVGWDFKNKEQFILQLHISPLFTFFPKRLWFIAWVYKHILHRRDLQLTTLWTKTYYDTILEKYIERFLQSACHVLNNAGVITNSFTYKIINEWAWKYKIISWDNSNEFEIKKFIEIVSKIFSPVNDQRYLFHDAVFLLKNWKKIWTTDVFFPLPSQLSWNKRMRKKWFSIFSWRKNAKPTETDFIYLPPQRKQHLWSTTFIKSEVEKIWI